MRQQLLFLELNELNFDYIKKYCEQGRLPHFAELLRRHALMRTTSEQRPDEIEPWIQWVTAHTGMSLAAHGVFRLGDIVNHDFPQIWEVLESQGLRVGAVSPMNAKHRARSPAFFIPDPWTSTKITGPKALRQLYLAIAQAVNDNAQSKVTLGSAARLALGAAAYARPRNYGQYGLWAASARDRPWRKAMFLDRLLTDVFMREVARTRPDFASLFLNAAAHIQHHYMFCSPCYEGPLENPPWYASRGVDPLLEVYESYDRIIADVIATFPGARLMLATGLHQIPHPELTYYWRLINHAEMMRELGVEFERCEPRMSRDFLVKCKSTDDADVAAQRLTRAIAADGMPLFEVDNRGTDVFVTLSYSREIGNGFTFSIDGKTFCNLDSKVVFVALKNGEHDGTGYFVDTGTGPDSRLEFPLVDLPDRIAQSFGLRFSSRSPLRPEVVPTA